MTMVSQPKPVIVANHYQNENCHPEGKIKVGIGQDNPWRWQCVENAQRLFRGARKTDIPIVHVRLAVPADYRGVMANTPMIRQWIDLGAWQEGSWGVEFIDGLAPAPGECVVTHSRNNGFCNSTLEEVLFSFGARSLICCGVSTAYTVESTVRHATDIGYEVTVVADACSTATAAQHDASLAAMRPLAEIRTVDEMLTLWKT